MEGGRNKTRLDFFLEKLTPAFGFGLIIFPVVMSIIAPDIAGIYMIIVVMYFFYKSLTTCLQFAIALLRLRNSAQIDWKALVDSFEDVPGSIAKLEKDYLESRNLSWSEFHKQDMRDGIDSFAESEYFTVNKNLPGFYKRLLFFFEKRKHVNFIKKQIKQLKAVEHKTLIKPSELQHILIIPFVNESESLLSESIDCIVKQNFNTKQISIVLAAEAAIKNGKEVAENLKNKYEKYFNKVWISNHVLQEEDIIGKSANMNWAARMVYEKVQELGWDMTKTTITSCDSDSKIPPEYYSYLSYKYILEGEDAKYKLFTGGLVFYNNIWRLPFYARVKNSFSSIYNVSKLVRRDKLVPVSTYSASFWLIKEIDFWTPWVTPEDYHIFFKCLFKFDSKVETIPLYLKIMSDAAEGDGHMDTIRNNYKQSRRWAWGISDTGWMIKNFFQGFFKHSLKTKYKTLHVIFDHASGPNIAILMLLGGNLPVIVNPDFSNGVFGTLLPNVTRTIVNLTLFFLFIIIVLDFYLKPVPEYYPWWKKVGRIFEWISQPFVGFFLAALPGMESQTRLLFGRYMDYYVTKKKASQDEKVQ